MASYGFKLIKIELREGQRQPVMDFGECQYLKRVHRDVTAAITRREDALADEEEARKTAEEAKNSGNSLPMPEEHSADLESEDVASESRPGETLMQDATSGAVTIASSEDVVNDSEDEPSLEKAGKKTSVVRFEESIVLKQAVLLRV